MKFKKSTPPPKRLHKTPARDRAREALVALLGKGRCVITADDVAEIAGISTTSARLFLHAGLAVGIIQPLQDRIPVTTSGHFLITESFPGAPSSDTITKAALLYVAHGKGEGTQAAFAYHTALSLHGLTEVAPTSLHVIKIRTSIHRPNLPQDNEYIPKVRPAKHWMDLPNAGPVFLTLRSAEQVSATELASCTLEGMPIMVTSPLLSLIDAWMHPDWCAGADRVTDAWIMYWTRLSRLERLAKKSDLSVLLAQATWPGLWNPLSKWAGNIVPELENLALSVEKMKRRCN